MKTVLAAAALSMVLATGAWAAQSPVERNAKELARFERYASPPQDSMHYFKLDNFQYLGKNASGDESIAIWTGVNQVYLLTLQSPCTNLDLPLTIGLTSSSGNVYVRADYVKYSDAGMPRRCLIETIRKVDYKAMRAAKKAAGAQSSGT